MATRNEHLVVIMLEPTPIGVEFEVWPQHITIVPWFHCDDEEKLDMVLDQIADRHKQFEATTGKTEDWGRDDKFQVVAVNDYTNQLQDLHQDVYDSLESNGFSIHQKDFLGGKYRPHITLNNGVQKAERQLWEGEIVPINQFTLISQIRLKKSGRMIKRLKKNYELKG